MPDFRKLLVTFSSFHISGCVMSFLFVFVSYSVFQQGVLALSDVAAVGVFMKQSPTDFPHGD